MMLYDQFAAGIVKTVLQHAPVLLEHPQSYESRAELMWAGSCSHNGISRLREPGDWATHQLEHELSGTYQVTHGAGLSALWPTWAKYVMDADIDRFAYMAALFFDIHESKASIAAHKGIEAMEAFFRQLHMPTRIQELKLTLSEQDFEQMAENCSYHETRTIGCVKKLNKHDMKKIYIEAY